MHYDGIIAFQKSPLFRLLTLLIQPRDYIMYTAGRASRHHWYLDESKHVIVNALDVTEAFLGRIYGINNGSQPKWNGDDAKMDWTVLDSERQEASALLKHLGVQEDDLLIGVVPGGGNNPSRDESMARRWNAKRFRELIDNLLTIPRTRIVLIGSLSDRPVAELITTGGTPRLHDLTGRSSVRIAAAVIARCRVLITNDTGPMHIAGALDIPVVSIFGPTGGLQKSPLNQNAVAIQSPLECSPCYYSVYRGCKFPVPQCMSAIDVNTVVAIALRALEDPNRRGGAMSELATVVRIESKQ
jgi:ADP-heptose:LPS heptosyltransferase